MRRLELTEHTATLGVALDPDEARLLKATGTMNVSPSLDGEDRWDLRPTSWVGVLHAGNLEVRIQPKLEVGRLLFLLAFARNQTGWQQTLAGFGEADDLVTAIVMGFAHHAERALTPHVLHGYLSVEDDLTTLRGRLREGDQLRRHFGLPLPVSVAYDEFTIDIPENRLLLSAAARLRRLWHVPLAGQQALRRIMVRLEDVTELPIGTAPPTIVLTRLNAPYGPALGLAELVIRNLSIEASVGNQSSVGFLFDMNRVFEDFLTAALTAELERFGGRLVPQALLTLDEEERITIRPDLTWQAGATCLAVMDAKYRSVAPSEMPNAHLYQMLAYCTAMGLSEGWLIYAAGNASPAIATIRRSGVAIHVVAIDLSGTPQEVLASVRALAQRIRQTVAIQAIRSSQVAAPA